MPFSSHSILGLDWSRKVYGAGAGDPAGWRTVGTGLGGGVGSGDWEMEKVPDQNLFPAPGVGEGQVVGGGASNIELSSSESPSLSSSSLLRRGLSRSLVTWPSS